MGRVSGVLTANGITLAEKPKREVLALDREFAEMEKQIKVLDAKCLKLEAQVKPLEREVERLKQQVQQKAAGKNVHQLEQIEIEMLKFIGEKRSVTSSDIQNGMTMHSVPCEHYLGRLLKSLFIGESRVPMVGAMYSLTDSGNAYLVENKLVPLPGSQAQQPNNPKGHHCDHCGGNQLRRTGSRPDPNFSEVGIKQAVYSCLTCGKESAFTKDES